MNKRTIPFLLISYVITAGLFSACQDFDDDYSANPAHLLSFSTDTVSFDTVFTTIGSATKEFMVYNRNKKPLNIESIRLANGSASGFRINVDGRNGKSFSDIPVPEKDSLYILVEVTVDPTGENNPLLKEDRIEFSLNGVTQNVLLQAYGQDATIIQGGLFIMKDTTWTAVHPYLVYDSIVVSEGATLSLEKGVSLYMHNKAKVIVGGSMHASGTLEEPVLFRGDRLDSYSSAVVYDRLPGQWDGICFKAESFDNVMDHVIIRNAQTGLKCDASTPDRTKLKISNSQITNMNDDVLYAENCHIKAVNTEFSHAGGKVAGLYGGSYYFAHCTFVNFLILRPGRSGEAVLNLANHMPYEEGDGETKKPAPLQKAVFENCIIDGSYSEGSTPLGGEIHIESIEESEMNYLFNHCAVKTKENDSPAFVNVQFITTAKAAETYKPSYKSMGNSENGYLYDYRPDMTKDKEGNPAEKQIVIGKADPVVAARYPSDRYGISRITGEDGPDIGAYEYVPDPEEKEGE